jgi:tetratricopeptide (TPR) repeat protein
MLAYLKQISHCAGLLFLVLITVGCQTPPQTQQLRSSLPNIAKRHEIKQVPFYPQQQYFCGPTTLSEVAAFYGLSKNPDDIARDTFIPGRKGTLQIDMVAATRKLGMVAYAQRQSTLSQLFSLVAENIPVIVLQNNGISWLPQWHYAVVIGYDLHNEEVLLHTGVTAYHRLNFATFERTWQRGGYWYLAMLPPDKVSGELENFLYAKASQELLDTGQNKAGLTGLQTAIAQWPDYWLPYFLLANHYFARQPLVAAEWFSKGYSVAKEQSAYLNNYAFLLNDLGCQEQAIKLINDALRLEPENKNLQDSKIQIVKARKSSTNHEYHCKLPTVD